MAFTREAVSQRHRPSGFGWSFPVSGAIIALTAFGAPLTDYTLAADTGAATVTGTDASLEYGRLLSADSGTFTVAGTDANLEYGRTLAADSGACAVTGTDATLAYGRRLAADSGAVVLTGTSATLTYGAAAPPDNDLDLWVANRSGPRTTIARRSAARHHITTGSTDGTEHGPRYHITRRL